MASASDNFNRTNSTGLGGNWTAQTGNFNVDGNQARVNGVDDALVAYTATPPDTADYSVEADIALIGDTAMFVGVGARCSTSALTCYALSASPSEISLYRYVAGTFADLASVAMGWGPAPVNNAGRLRLTVSGTNPVLLLCELDTGSGFAPITGIGTNGVYSDSSGSRITAANYAGVVGYAPLSTNNRLDNWSFADSGSSVVDQELAGAASACGALSNPGTLVAEQIVPVIRVDEAMRDTDSGELIQAEGAEVVVLGGTPGSRTIAMQTTANVEDGVLEVEGGTIDADYLVVTIEDGSTMSVLPATGVNASE